MKSKFIAYVLWLFGGIPGLHKFYLGKFGMGLLYLCTGGFFGIGWLIDLFTLGSQVDTANALYLAQNGSPIFINTAERGDAGVRVPPENMAGFSAEKQILILSEKTRVLDIRQIVAGTHLDVEEAEAALAHLQERNLCRLKVDESGKARYDFG